MRAERHPGPHSLQLWNERVHHAHALTLQRERKHGHDVMFKLNSFFPMIINRNINANNLLICIMRTNQANGAAKRETLSLVIILETLEIDSCHIADLLL